MARGKPEAAGRAQSDLLAAMSHALRTPMNGVLGMVELAIRDAGDDRQAEWLALARQSGRQLMAVVDDILDLSRIEAGKLVLEDAEFAVDDTLARACEIVAGAARDKGLELVLDASGLPARLRGDATRLLQIFIKLLDNAIEFTRQGWVRIRGETVREEAGRLLLRFEVRDTGEGIPAQRQPALFEAFSQADGPTTRHHGGTGLGLALARHLVQLMGGEIGQHSVPGQGSTIWFTVALAPGREAAPAPGENRWKGRRALLVDDLPEALAAEAGALRRLGLHVETETGGSAALRRLEDRGAEGAGPAFDLMLIDWRMPAPDGLETARALRELPQAGAMAVVLMTAQDDALLRLQARDAQIGAVLAKPFGLAKLGEALESLLPAQGEAPARTAAEAGDPEALLRRGPGGRRVLVAEDDLVSRQVIVELLRQVGFVVETAGDGRQALELALGRSYDLVLMDMRMPELDGLAVARALRERTGRGLPIVAVTANAFSEDRAHCLAAGMDDFLSKPVDPQRLYETLLRWLPPALPDAPQPAAATLYARLAAVDGIDPAVALRNVGGKRAGLERLVRAFVDAYPDGEPALVDLEAPQGLACAAAASHSLRGASAVIGATRLEHAAQAFESRCDEASDLPALAQQGRQLNDELVAMVERLRAVCGE